LLLLKQEHLSIDWRDLSRHLSRKLNQFLTGFVEWHSSRKFNRWQKIGIERENKSVTILGEQYHRSISIVDQSNQFLRSIWSVRCQGINQRITCNLNWDTNDLVRNETTWIISMGRKTQVKVLKGKSDFLSFSLFPFITYRRFWRLFAAREKQRCLLLEKTDEKKTWVRKDRGRKPQRKKLPSLVEEKKSGFLYLGTTERPVDYIVGGGEGGKTLVILFLFYFNHCVLRAKEMSKVSKK